MLVAGRVHVADSEDRDWRASADATRWAARVGVAILVALVAGACRGDGGPRDGDQPVGPLPTAPDSARVDLVVPEFPDPTEITNQLFPISKLTQVLQLGTEEDAPVRVEFTVLPETRTIDWQGTQVETRIAQFVALREGRIVEAARDFFAQGADGSVWYFGEEVDNYDDGVVADHEGAWLAGRDGPPGMIMPANPVVGAVYRPENIPDVVLEEVTVKAVNETVRGPAGPDLGAILVRELLMEGTIEDKAFAPGYGELRATPRRAGHRRCRRAHRCRDDPDARPAHEPVRRGRARLRHGSVERLGQDLHDARLDDRLVGDTGAPPGLHRCWWPR